MYIQNDSTFKFMQSSPYQEGVLTFQDQVWKCCMNSDTFWYSEKTKRDWILNSSHCYYTMKTYSR